MTTTKLPSLHQIKVASLQPVGAGFYVFENETYICHLKITGFQVGFLSVLVKNNQPNGLTAVNP